MKSETRARVIKCPLQNRLVEVTYRTIGNWFNREYVVETCPLMLESGCDRQCKNLLSISPKSVEWGARC